MKVVRPRGETEVTFSALSPGDVFRCGDAAYMRTGSAVSRCAYKTPLNAVVLESGRLMGFTGTELVVKLPNARLVLGREA